MKKINIEKEAEKFIKEIKSVKKKVNKSNDFEVNYARQYEKSDYEYFLSIIGRREHVNEAIT